MSSTNRGAKRVDQDSYPTPLEAFTPLIPYIPRSGVIWEPACGDGRLMRALVENNCRVGGSDLANGYDFLKDSEPRYCIVTNPPYSIGFEFCKHAVDRAEHVFLLLPLNFLGSSARRPWFHTHEVSALFVLSDRPSFVCSVTCRAVACNAKWFVPIDSERPKACDKCGGKSLRFTTSDSSNYAWFYWGKLYKGIFHL